MRTDSEEYLKRISEALFGIKKELSDINKHLEKLEKQEKSVANNPDEGDQE